MYIVVESTRATENLAFQDVELHEVFKRNADSDQYLKLSDKLALNLVTTDTVPMVTEAHVEKIVGRAKSLTVELEI